MKMYIAGPMQGIPEFNFPAFHAVAKLYRELGYEVFNPAENDLKNGYDPSVVVPSGIMAELEAIGFSRRLALRDDLCWIAEHATDIHMLPGWEKSGGAFAEWALAKTIGCTIHYGN